MKSAPKERTAEKESICSREFASDDIALRYLARILVQAYFDHKEHERNKTNNKKESGDLLSGIN